MPLKPEGTHDHGETSSYYDCFRLKNLTLPVFCLSPNELNHTPQSDHWKKRPVRSAQHTD